jgi:hypothetical protein
VEAGLLDLLLNPEDGDLTSLRNLSELFQATQTSERQCSARKVIDLLL